MPWLPFFLWIVLIFLGSSLTLAVSVLLFSNPGNGFGSFLPSGTSFSLPLSPISLDWILFFSWFFFLLFFSAPFWVPSSYLPSCYSAWISSFLLFWASLMCRMSIMMSTSLVIDGFLIAGDSFCYIYYFFLFFGGNFTFSDYSSSYSSTIFSSIFSSTSISSISFLPVTSSVLLLIFFWYFRLVSLDLIASTPSWTGDYSFYW